VGADTHHLALVFFDVLLLDSISLLSTPYAQRREILESIVRPISGKSMFSERVPIDLHSRDETQALSTLERIFKAVVDNHQEGIILKAEEASYHDFRTQWVKLKKDYIPGYGDALDLVVVGAGWEKARARELRGLLFFYSLLPTHTSTIPVAPTALTTLYIGVLVNPYPTTENVCLP
jgi:DNA ligase 4